MRLLRRAIIGRPLSLFFLVFLIGFEHEVTVNYERAGTESTTNFELPVDRLCSSLCHCGALPIGTNPTVTIAVPTTPDGGSFKTIRYLRKRDANELSVTIVDRTDAMHGFLFAYVTTHARGMHLRGRIK